MGFNRTPIGALKIEKILMSILCVWMGIDATP